MNCSKDEIEAAKIENITEYENLNHERSVLLNSEALKDLDKNFNLNSPSLMKSMENGEVSQNQKKLIRIYQTT